MCSPVFAHLGVGLLYFSYLSLSYFLFHLKSYFCLFFSWFSLWRSVLLLTFPISVVLSHLYLMNICVCVRMCVYSPVTSYLPTVPALLDSSVVLLLYSFSLDLLWVKYHFTFCCVTCWYPNTAGKNDQSLWGRTTYCSVKLILCESSSIYFIISLQQPMIS